MVTYAKEDESLPLAHLTLSLLSIDTDILHGLLRKYEPLQFDSLKCSGRTTGWNSTGMF